MKPSKTPFYKHSLFGYTLSEKNQYLHENITIDIEPFPLLDFPSLVFLGQNKTFEHSNFTFLGEDFQTWNEAIIEMFLISSLQLLWTKQVSIDYTQDVKKLLGKPFLTDTFYLKIEEKKGSQDIIVNNIFECFDKNNSPTTIKFSDVIDLVIEKHIGSEERNIPYNVFMIKLLTEYQNKFPWIKEETSSSKLIVFENNSFALSEEKIEEIRTFRESLHQNINKLDQDTFSLFQKLQTHIKECVHKSFSERTSSGGD